MPMLNQLINTISKNIFTKTKNAEEQNYAQKNVLENQHVKIKLKSFMKLQI